ncbi:hypothetical protein [Photobacterium lutimaris]|uniref:Uncharacterized protein n=1 Tax=Photobacterium lutimaris TaxID=388278 RepID=A0A2T3ITT9_9GAMM|nr:hypothetical protein [Photobacterium lutimaris]PSU31779.1 hypothetical protein C9I99_21585 [Photobacterium lutimaris]TDR72568.1 hypothetical protein DFP78_11344 [Photobacterium lutimaris]
MASNDVSLIEEGGKFAAYLEEHESATIESVAGAYSVSRTHVILALRAHDLNSTLLECFNNPTSLTQEQLARLHKISEACNEAEATSCDLIKSEFKHFIGKVETIHANLINHEIHMHAMFKAKTAHRAKLALIRQRLKLKGELFDATKHAPPMDKVQAVPEDKVNAGVMTKLEAAFEGSKLSSLAKQSG